MKLNLGQILMLTLVGHSLDCQMTQPDDCVHRGADFMAHIGKKFALCLIGGFGPMNGVLELLLEYSALCDICADDDVLEGFSLTVQKRDNGCIEPVRSTRFVSVGKFTLPCMSMTDGGPNLFDGGS